MSEYEAYWLPRNNYVDLSKNQTNKYKGIIVIKSKETKVITYICR